ncbi:tRNA pseudouridine(38-40) synthase TruA [Agaribacter marinus]|uniref:tRNA pseudouridine synthase A n=1 Tax=Agaribacter marinus TaxID=1431249 RepID=A0AA37SUM1_9ALTE|nr:tRNA pseudouridine(38-40) synthase TruA [Agaribacter marinus]GLR69432.1 tRNA pseudouridine synthase A [Agaribacter marinus]
MRFALGIEYQGHAYKGWQSQTGLSTVQANIERCLSQIMTEKVDVVCAGRTDAGVHATNQIVHFDTNISRPMNAFTLGMNSNLPGDIAIRWAQQVDDDFHARFSATARRYRYIIFNNPFRPGILSTGLTHVYKTLNAEPMHEAAQVLVGENDFTSFRAAHCQSNSPCRNLTSISVERRGQYIVVEVEANAFLHHMVRNIVGSLIEVGAGEQSVTWFNRLLALKDRTKAAATAKPNGLYLVKVTYPEKFNIPTPPLGPLFLGA